MTKTKKRKRSIFPVILLFIAGLALLLYPYISNEWNNYRQSQLISNYETVVAEKEDEIDYSGEWKRANEYNKSLLPSILPDSFAIAAANEEPDEEYMACLNIAEDGMMGMIEIPKINISFCCINSTTG